MKTIYEKWWKNESRVFSVVKYRTHRNFSVNYNGAKKKSGDKHLDISLTIGKIIINYTNYDLQNTWSNKKEK